MIDLTPGAIVNWNSKRYVIIEPNGLDSVIAKEKGSRRKVSIPIGEISLEQLLPESPASQVRDISTIDPVELEIAESEFELLRPLLRNRQRARTFAEVENVAGQAGLSAKTIYRKLKKLQTNPRLSSLLRKKRIDAGRKRLDPKIEGIISNVIQATLKSQLRLSPANVFEDVKLECRKLGLTAPHMNTVKSRIHQLKPEIKDTQKFGRHAAKQRHQPLRGHFPGADHPLAAIQIDHTPCDVILVDDRYRESIGRAYLTLAIEIFSRIVLGFFVSLEHPGVMSTAMCISRSILPKEKWLVELGIDGTWPCWGMPGMIHTDNAREFRSEALRLAAKEHGIVLARRARGFPNQGGHIERAFGTFMSEVHKLPGTTFSNVQDKGKYDAEGHAVMTMTEFEKWFTTFLVKVYHQKVHSEISCPPIVRWEEGILGTADFPGIGLPPRFEDEHKIRLDFMPMEMRTVQRYGILLNHIYYYHDVLRAWIHEQDAVRPKNKRQFVVRFDPRDMSSIWLFDEDLKTYHQIPYRNTGRPAVSYWEIRDAERLLRKRGISMVNEDLIFEGILEMRGIQEESAHKTKKARRDTQRRVEQEKARKSAPKPAKAQTKVIQSDDDDETPVSAFDGIVEAE